MPLIARSKKTETPYPIGQAFQTTRVKVKRARKSAKKRKRSRKRRKRRSQGRGEISSSPMMWKIWILLTTQTSLLDSKKRNNSKIPPMKKTMRKMRISNLITIAKLMMSSNTLELANMTRRKKNIQNSMNSSITTNNYSTRSI